MHLFLKSITTKPHSGTTRMEINNGIYHQPLLTTGEFTGIYIISSCFKPKLPLPALYRQLRVIHLFPTNFGQSACNSVKVQPISTLRSAESYPTGCRTAERPKLPALFPKCMHSRLNWPEKRFRYRYHRLPPVIKNTGMPVADSKTLHL